MHMEICCLYLVSCHKRSFAALATLIFLFSANALLFASHAAEEMQVGAGRHISDQIAGSGNPRPMDHYHAHDEENAKGGETRHRDCCSSHGPHSHDLTDAPPPALIPSLSVAILKFQELNACLPEVFFDLFVPPQNLA